MKFSMTGQEKGDFLIEVTEWTCLTLWFKVEFSTLKGSYPISGVMVVW